MSKSASRRARVVGVGGGSPALRKTSWRIPVVASAACLAAIALASTTANGATITWGSPTATAGDTDVATTGTLAYAYNLGFSNATNTTVNGVQFLAFGENLGHSVPVSTSDGNLTVSTSDSQQIVGYNEYGTGSGGGALAGISSSYSELLTEGFYNATATSNMLVTLNNLTSGDTYEVQLWVNDARNNGSGPRQETVTGGANTSGLLDYDYDYYAVSHTTYGTGEYVIGTFTADASTQALTLNQVNGPAQLNGLEVLVVPEPATLSLGALGSILLLMRRRRHSAAVA